MRGVSESQESIQKGWEAADDAKVLEALFEDPMTKFCMEHFGYYYDGAEQSADKNMQKVSKIYRRKGAAGHE